MKIIRIPFKLTTRNFFRSVINKRNIKRLTNNNPTIISSNCNGGVILHDLNLQFFTPTVNLFMFPKDFLKFVGNLNYYLSSDAELNQVESTLFYPVGRLIDIEIHFMHYPTFEEAKEKWFDMFDRCKRIQGDNIFLMMTDRDGCTYEDMVDFDKLPYKKVIFTNKPYSEIKSSFYIRGFEDKDSVGVLSEEKNLMGIRYLDKFDYVSFLNTREDSNP
jgi:uncharacterized protein (DUF1919 family)